MFITIPQRSDVPETELFAKILKKNKARDACWDRDVILLMHGGPGGNHSLYADIEASLFEIADLILLDLRGCGLSKKIDAKHCTLDTHIDDLESVLEALQIPKPIIHGCSYGALVALGFSIKYPRILSKLILSSCVASGAFIEKAKENLKRIGSTKQIQTAERLWTGAFETQEQLSGYYYILAPLYFFKYDQQTILPAASNKIPYNIELVNLAFTTFLRTFDFTDKLSSVSTSTLIFSGKQDWIFDTKQTEILKHGIKNSVLISLDDCGHFPWKDQRDIFLSKIRTFIGTNVDQDIALGESSSALEI